MKIKEIEIYLRKQAEPEALDAGHLQQVALPPLTPKKKKQKRWQPPLQQMLDTVKAGVGVTQQLVDPTDPAAKLAVAKALADPAASLAETKKTRRK
jgi:hypothetical protein